MMPLWAIDLCEELIRLLIRLFCKLCGADDEAIDALLDVAEEMG